MELAYIVGVVVLLILAVYYYMTAVVHEFYDNLRAEGGDTSRVTLSIPRPFV